MSRRLISILTSLIVLLPTAFSLSAQDYVFNTMSTKNGFPSKISTIFAQEKGFVWAGSDKGLARIDNSSFKVYTAGGKPGAIPGDNIYKVFADREGDIWALTEGGMARYDGNTDTFFVPTVENGGKKSPVIAYSMLETENGFIAGGDNVLYEYNTESGEVSVLKQPISDNGFKVTSLHGWQGGKILLHSRAEGLLLFDRADYGVTAGPAVPEGQISALLVDSDGDLWVSAYNRGLEWMAADGTPKGSYNTGNGGLLSDIVLCVDESINNIWVGTDGGGIAIIDKESGKVKRTLSHEKDDLSYIPSDSILSLYCESDDVVWAGRSKGGLISIRKSMIVSYLSGDFQYRSKSEGITALYQDERNPDTIWAGSEGSGLIKFTSSTGAFRYFNETEGLKVFDITSYPGGKLFITTIAGGFFTFDPATERLEKTSTGCEELENYARYSGTGVGCETGSDGRRIVLGTDKLYRFDPSSGRVEVLGTADGVTPGGLTTVFGKSSESYLHNKTGLYVWNRVTDFPENIMELGENATINSASIGREGEIWLATEDGIGCFLRSDGSYTPVQTEAFSFEGAQSIIYDSKGRLWVGTRKGMYVYYPADGNVVALGSTDGVSRNEYATKARLKIGSYLYFGGTKGLLKIDQNINFDLNVVPELTLTDLYLDGERVSDNSKLRLSQSYKSLNFEILAKEENLLREKTYRFKVKGPGIEDIIESGSPTATLSYHQTGKYRVYASCTGANGKWVDWKEILSFRVNTKWYLSVWSILAFLALMAGGAGLYVNHILKMRAEHQVREADEERIKFLVNVSHELRTPLTLVLGPLGRILREMSEEDPRYNTLANVNRQALRMKSLLNTVLTAHKIEEGASSLNLGSRDLGEWIDHVVSGFRDEAKGRNINLVTKFDKNVKNLSFDDDKCQIVLSNILMNAVKHSPSDTTITVSTEARRLDGMVRVAVSDQGNGISIKDTSKLFERFYQEAGNSGNGFGIGLSYCKTIIEQHKGKIGAFNNADGGATFYYDLPANIMESADVPASVQEGLKSLVHKASKGGVKDATVLIVEDNEDFRRFLSDELRHKVHNVIVAGNGAEALELVNAEHVDVILSDVMMPVMDGFELCRKVKEGEAGHPVPVVLMTARNDDNSRTLSEKVGAAGYLVKPFETEDLLTVFKGLLEHNQ